MSLRRLALFFCCFFCPIYPATAAISPLNFSVNMSEAVNVDTTGGTPTISIDVGGLTRTASYTSGTGTSALTFAYTPTAGDLDLDGITLSSPITLNGGTIRDLAGNDATLTYTLPNTAGININNPTVSLDFLADADGQYSLNGAVYNDISSFLTAAGGTYTRASVGTYYDASGNLLTASSGNIRFDHNPASGNAARGALIEDSRTNILLRSEELEVAIWTQTNGSISANATTAPSGSTTADKFVETAVAGRHQLNQSFTLSASTAYTVSFFAKQAERSKLEVYVVGSDLKAVGFNLATGATFATTIAGVTAPTSSSMTSVGNGWYRCAMIWTTSGTPTTQVRIAVNDGTTANSYTGVATNGLYIWGTQIEAGSAPTSYIPTTSATVTRAADVLTIPTGSWTGSSVGTLFGQAVLPYLGTPLFPGVLSLDDGSVSNALNLLINDGGGDQVGFTGYSGGTLQLGSNGGVYTPGNVTKSALAYAANNAIAAYDNSLTALDTAVTIPSLSILRIGNRRGGIDPLNGWVQKIRYYPQRASDTQTQLLTQ